MQSGKFSPLGREVYDKIQSSVEHPKEEGQITLYFEGGHFDPSADVTEFATNSLTQMLQLAEESIIEYKKRINVVLGILVDNLGQQCGISSCSIDTKTKSAVDIKGFTDLPVELREILDNSRIVKPQNFVITSERAAKNRGIKTMKTLLKQPTESITALRNNETTEYIYQNKGKKIVIVKEQLERWAAQCPLIMAQHYKDVFALITCRFPQNKNKVLLDFSEMADETKVTNGAHLALHYVMSDREVVGSSIHNIFYWDDEGEDGTIVTTY